MDIAFLILLFLQPCGALCILIRKQHEKYPHDHKPTQRNKKNSCNS